MDVLSHVDRLRVSLPEVAASRSFCSPHLVLPVNAAFYSLDDNHGGTSPYLVRNVS